jgi:hypothetical protein
MAKPKHRKRMMRVGTWDLKPRNDGDDRKPFIGTLIKTFNFGNKRLALFSVPKDFKKEERNNER